MQLRKRFLGTLADLAIRRPRSVCVAAAVVAALSVVVVVAFGLRVETSRAALWPDDHPLQERFRAFEDEFGSSLQLIVAVEGAQPAHNKAVADRIAARIRAEVPSIENVFYRIDLAAVKERALLFAPTDDLRQAAQWAEKLSPAEAQDGELRLGGLVGMLTRANEALAGIEEGETKALAQLDEHIGTLLDSGGRGL